MQAVLARLYTDRAFRACFFDEPKAVCNGLPLTQAEIAGLSQIDRGQVERFARSLVKKREEHVRAVVPGLSAALGDGFREHFAEYCDEHPSAAEPIKDAALFVEFLSHLAIDGPTYVVDILRVERLRIEILSQGEPASRDWQVEIGATSRLRLTGNVRVAEFDRDMEELYGRLLQGDLPSAAMTPCTVLIGKVLGSASIKLRQLNPETARLVNRCDGTWTVERMIEEASESLGLGVDDGLRFSEEARCFLMDLVRARLADIVA
jgi:hypothetical protein